jgi:hypothetical protein
LKLSTGIWKVPKKRLLSNSSWQFVDPHTGIHKVSPDKLFTTFAVSWKEPKKRRLSPAAKSSWQFLGLNRGYHEMKAEFALSGIVPSILSDARQEEAV